MCYPMSAPEVRHGILAHICNIRLVPCCPAKHGSSERQRKWKSPRGHVMFPRWPPLFLCILGRTASLRRPRGPVFYQRPRDNTGIRAGPNAIITVADALALRGKLVKWVNYTQQISWPQFVHNIYPHVFPIYRAWNGKSPQLFGNQHLYVYLPIRSRNILVLMCEWAMNFCDLN